jgi:hypothetical protein
MAKPLLDLLKKELFFKWKEEQYRAFEDLEKTNLFAPVYKVLDFTKSFEVHTNANDFSIGGVLMQKVFLIAFKNKKFFEAQLQWLIHLRSCMQLSVTLKHGNII